MLTPPYVTNSVAVAIIEFLSLLHKHTYASSLLRPREDGDEGDPTDGARRAGALRRGTRPTSGPSDLVVNIYAAGVNAADYKVRLGRGRYALKRFPHILGRNFSGVVSALGAGVTDFAVGDPVFGVTDQGVKRAYAEKIALKVAIIARKPNRLSHAEAAALGL